jgi:hypothetical protein
VFLVEAAGALLRRQVRRQGLTRFGFQLLRRLALGAE